MNRKEIKFEVLEDTPWKMRVTLMDGISGNSIDRVYCQATLPSSPKSLIALQFLYLRWESDDGKMSGAYRGFTKRFGITPSKYIQLVKGKYYELVVKPVDDLVGKYGITSPRGKPSVSATKLMKIIPAKDKIRQAQKDGLDNIVPLILYLNKCPKELRKLFGKSMWKHLCKNSHYRNLKIAEAVEYNILFGPNLGHKLGSIKQGVDEYIKDLPASKMRAVLGNNLFILDLLSTGDVARGLVFSLPTKDLERVGVNMLSDIFQEMKKLNVFPLHKNIKSRDDLLKLHSQMSDTLRWIEVQKSMSSDPYESLSWLDEKEGAFNGVKWKIISSNRELYKEAEEMKHCVYSYRGHITIGEYIVVSLECNEERATAGFSTYKRELYTKKDWTDTWAIDQVYGKMNSEIRNLDIPFCVHHLLEKFNRIASERSLTIKEAA